MDSQNEEWSKGLAAGVGEMIQLVTNQVEATNPLVFRDTANK